MEEKGDTIFKFPEDLEDRIYSCETLKDRFNLCLQVFRDCETLTEDEDIEWFYIFYPNLYDFEKTLYILVSYDKEEHIFKITKRCRESFKKIKLLLYTTDPLKFRFLTGLKKVEGQTKDINRLFFRYKSLIEKHYGYKTEENYDKECNKDFFNMADIVVDLIKLNSELMSMIDGTSKDKNDKKKESKDII